MPAVKLSVSGGQPVGQSLGQESVTQSRVSHGGWSAKLGSETSQGGRSVLGKADDHRLLVRERASTYRRAFSGITCSERVVNHVVSIVEGRHPADGFLAVVSVREMT
jgi:hypothetical protein